DLDLEIVAPGGAVYRPFVMPHVGDWTSATFNSPATTGINTTDNVEQVLIDSPPAPGVYQVRVSHSNALSGGLQHFSLIISGAAGNDPAPAPDIVSLSPAIATLSQ